LLSAGNMVVLIGLFLVVLALYIATRLLKDKKGDRIYSQQTAFVKSEVSTVSQLSPATMENPGQSDELIEVIDCSSIEIPSPERPYTEIDAVLIDLIRQGVELPSAALELSRLLQDPEVGAKQVSEVASTDPVLSARLLRIANSPAFSTGKIRSLQQAIALLGFNQVWILVNQMLTARSIQHVTNLDNRDMYSLWQHAAATATCAKHLLLKLGYVKSPKGSMVLTSALLHDVGKFLLKVLEPHHVNQETLVDSESSCLPSIMMEDASLGIDHCRVGFLLTTYWSLPEEICTIIAYHHHGSFSNWEDCPNHVREQVLLVALSDLMANIAGYYEANPVACELPAKLTDVLGLKVPVRDLITRELKRDLRHTETLIKEAIA
jgi:HD-like signal output (HDOD) protein